MVKFELLVCAETLLKDAERDSFSAINIMQDVVAEHYPTVLPMFQVLLISSIFGEAPLSPFEVELSVLNNATLLHSRKLSIDFKGHDRANTRVAVGNLMVKEPGKLTIRFAYGAAAISFAIGMKLRNAPAHVQNVNNYT